MTDSTEHTELERTCLCFVIVDEKILLLERQNTWYENGKYLPPGGIVNDTESPTTAATRELFEETGIVVDEGSLNLVYNYQNKLDGRQFDNYYFLTRECSGVAENKEPMRHSKIGWFPLDKLPPNTSSVVHEFISKISLI